MIFTVLVLVVGLFFLAKFSEVAIKAAVKLSELLGISELAIGFILIAVSTSLPELFIAIMSSLRNEGLLSVGNVLGANVLNITLIFGIISIIAKITIKKNDFRQIVKAVSITSLLLIPLLFLEQIWWAFGFLCIAAFLFYSRSILKEGYRISWGEKVSGLKIVETLKNLIISLASIAIVILSAKFVTDSAIEIAGVLNIAESLIGASILSFGTTLPELSVAVAAVRRGKIGIAIGDGIGSIITNMTLVLGVASLANPIVVGVIVKLSAVMLLGINLLFLTIASRMRLEKIHGFILLSAFALFMLSLFYAGTVL